MHKLVDNITIDRPISCTECPFDSNDSDYGPMCCGKEKDSYKAEGYKTLKVYVSSPQEAIEHGCECMFIGI